MAPLPDGKFRVTGFDPHDQNPTEPLTIDRLRESAARAAGRDFGIRDATWLSRYGNATRQAATYRSGRVLVAGDAAHMHMPAGGVGLNLGVQDAMNLGWKLAAVAQGRAGGELLDSYHRERHPVGAAVLENTLAQTALITAFTRQGLALRSVFARMIDRNPALATDLALSMSGLDVTYRAADPLAHPLTGSRVGDTTLYPLLVGGHPVLIQFSEPGRPGRAVPDRDDLALSAAAIGAIPHRSSPWPGHEKCAFALVRPDGYVWWATDEPDPTELASELATLGATFATLTHTQEKALPK